MIFVIALLTALFAFLTVFLGVVAFRRNQSIDIFHRLRRHVNLDSQHFRQTQDTLRRAYNFVKRVAKPLERFNFAKSLDFKLKQAGIPLYGAEFVILVLIAAVLGTAAIYVITLNVAILPFVAIGIPLGLWFYVSIRVGRRRQAFTEQLGDCLTTVANALRAGYSFQQAMDVVSQEMEPPISTEFERVSADVAMGMAMETALENMNKRVGSSDFDLVVTAVLIQREVGGNLAQVLDTISDTINERIRMKREINTLTAQGRFSAWTLMLLPFFVAGFCLTFNAEQMKLFISEEMGRFALAFAVLMEIFGFIVIQKIVDIEV